MPADSHCHLNDPAFDSDLEEVVARIEEAGIVHILNVGCDLATSKRAIELAEKYEYMVAAVGIHPHNAASADDDALAQLREMAKHPKVVAIGETGLDYYRDRSPRDLQEVSFRRHLALAKEMGKPVIIHCRDAMERTLQVLKEENVGETGGVMHCFAGTPQDVRRCLDLNLYISFAGNVTYPKATMLRESLAVVPGHRLLVETDSPYLAPQKKRGKRNDPTFLTYVIDQAVKTRNVTRDDMERIAVTNFEELFGLSGAAAGEVAYKIRNSLYLNVTMRCTNECHFCARYYSDTVQGHNLRLKSDPAAEQMIEAIGDPKIYDEIVFCGYGEPTLRLKEVEQVAKTVKEKGGVTRLNSNGHGSYIAGHDITPELVGLIDHVSVSLNAADADTYNEICSPQIPDAWEKTVEFIRSAKAQGMDVTATVVAIPEKVDIEACRKFAEDELKVKFRVREYDLVG